MEQIVIQMKNKEKAKVLYELLASLDFIDSIETTETTRIKTKDGKIDFFSVAGLWEGRDVTVESIRKKGWPRQDV